MRATELELMLMQDLAQSVADLLSSVPDVQDAHAGELTDEDIVSISFAMAQHHLLPKIRAALQESPQLSQDLTRASGPAPPN